MASAHVLVYGPMVLIKSVACRKIYVKYTRMQCTAFGSWTAALHPPRDTEVRKLFCIITGLHFCPTKLRNVSANLQHSHHMHVQGAPVSSL